MLTNKELKALQEEYQAAFEKSSEVLNKLLDDDRLGWPELVEKHRSSDEYKEYNRLRIKYFMNCRYELEDMPEDANLMTIEEFTKCCKSYMFIDDDGAGNYATATKLSSVPIRPSDVCEGHIRKDFTHVVWFNK